MDEAAGSNLVDRNTRAILSFVSGYLVNRYASSAAVIDLGCGRGWLLQELSKKGFSNLTGVGYDVPDLEYARVIVGIDLCMQGWADRCGLGQYDVAIATEVIEHLANPYLSLKETHRLLRTGAELVRFRMSITCEVLLLMRCTADFPVFSVQISTMAMHCSISIFLSQTNILCATFYESRGLL